MSMRGTLKDRFNEKLAPNLDANGCRLWQGSRHSQGYGQIYHKKPNGSRTMLFAHRVAWELEYGPIPAGLCVCHSCDVPRCVNTVHLFLGTRGDNMLDKARKGRSNVPQGNFHPNAKLSPDEVRAIRNLNRYADFSTRRLARLFYVSQPLVVKIINRKTWANI